MKERPSYLPSIPELWPHPDDYVPDSLPTVTTALDTPLQAQEQRAKELPATSREKQPRLTLSGRLGSSVVFGQTPKGQPKGHFMLGVHTPTETGVKTDWRAILTFGERVNQLRALNLTKGEAARVVGYIHTKKTKTKTGTKTVEEIYAVAIQRL